MFLSALFSWTFDRLAHHCKTPLSKPHPVERSLVIQKAGLLRVSLETEHAPTLEHDGIVGLTKREQCGVIVIGCRVLKHEPGATNITSSNEDATTAQKPLNVHWVTRGGDGGGAASGVSPLVP